MGAASLTQRQNGRSVFNTLSCPFFQISRHCTSTCDKNTHTHWERHTRNTKLDSTFTGWKIQGKKIKCSLSLPGWFRRALNMHREGRGEKRKKRWGCKSLISWKKRCGWCCTTGDKAFVLGARPVKRPAAEARWLEWWCDAGEAGEGFGGVVGQNQSNRWLRGEQAKTK